MAYLGEEIGKLGFGLMRLPRKGEEIDVEQVKAMVDKFMEAASLTLIPHGSYNGSEDAIRQALVERYPRESFQLATKCAAWINCKTREEAVSHVRRLPGADGRRLLRLLTCCTTSANTRPISSRITTSGALSPRRKGGAHQKHRLLLPREAR
jgi:hypothetical protein